MRIVGRFFGELLLLGGLSLLALLSGCMSLDYSPRERLITAQREFTDGVRWGRLAECVQKLIAEKRVGFVDRHKALEEDLEVADWDIVSIDLDEKDSLVDGKKVKKARVRVQYQWMLRNQGIVLGEDSEKMSKSRGNVEPPDSLVETYGADTVRAYLMFRTKRALLKNGLTRRAPTSLRGISSLSDIGANPL